MVHSIPIPLSGQSSLASVRDRPVPSDEACKKPRETERSFGNVVRGSQAPQRFHIANPAQAIGPTTPYDHGKMNDVYDPRRFRRQSVLPPQPTIPPAYRFPPTMGKRDPDGEPMEADRVYAQYRPPHHYLPTRASQDIAIDTRPSPFYISSSAVNPDRVGRGDTTSAAPSGAHRNISPAQLDMSEIF